MGLVEHKNATQVHKARYIQSSDPGAVGTGVEWLDTTTTPAVHKKRNAANDGWDTVLDPSDYAPLDSPAFTTAATLDGEALATEQYVDAAVAASGGGGGGAANHAYYTYKAAALEPLAIESIQYGAFSYAVGSSATKLLLNAWNTRIGATGRLDLRDPSRPIPLRGVTLTGLSAQSLAALIDPTLATYADARTTYLDRLTTLATTAPKFLGVAAPSTLYPFLPGPYGSIITGVTIFDLTWIGLSYDGGVSAFNLANEIGDTGASDYQRVGVGLAMPVSKRICGAVLSGAERSAGAGKGGLTYILCPSSWGAVTDSTSYLFRDDFMGASLDTATKWTRSQSTAGNVEINTDFAWCVLAGNGTWGANGARGQATTARAAGKVFLCDVYTGSSSTSNFPGIVGWNDGGGNSYTNMAHGVNFTRDGSNNPILQIFENGNNRGTVGSGWSAHTIYRVRITLGASSATYEIQGGTQYGKLGSATWTTLSPGTGSSSTTTPLTAGFATAANGSFSAYVGDVRVY